MLKNKFYDCKNRMGNIYNWFYEDLYIIIKEEKPLSTM